MSQEAASCRRPVGPNPLPTRSFGTFGQPPSLNGKGAILIKGTCVCGYAIGKVAAEVRATGIDTAYRLIVLFVSQLFPIG